MAEQGSIKVGDLVRGRHSQDNRAFKVESISKWPRTDENVLHGSVRVGGWVSGPRQEFEANVEIVR